MLNATYNFVILILFCSLNMMNAMRQLEERHVATKVELMVWCNKMDLLALSNVRGIFLFNIV